MPKDLTPEQAKALVTSTRRFDLRRILGALFVVYGVIVLVIGLFNNASDMKQTGGIAINIWTGAAMLVLGLLFFLWDRLSPVPEEDILASEEHEDEQRQVGEGH
jgi:hypothetical protein